MIKLLLTSTGFVNKNISKVFLKLVNKSASNIKVLFIPIASRSKEELHYVAESRKELISLGIKEDNIFNLEIDNKPDLKELNKLDVIYVCGGNTFYLLHKLKETGFYDIIKDLVRKNKIYVGVSAGSIVVGPDIKIASIGDKNDIKLKNFMGLCLTKTIVSPHFCNKERGAIEKFRKTTNFRVVPLNDMQALLVLGDKERVIK